MRSTMPVTSQSARKLRIRPSGGTPELDDACIRTPFLRSSRLSTNPPQPSRRRDEDHSGNQKPEADHSQLPVARGPRGCSANSEDHQQDAESKGDHSKKAENRSCGRMHVALSNVEDPRVSTAPMVQR